MGFLSERQMAIFRCARWVSMVVHAGRVPTLLLASAGTLLWAQSAHLKRGSELMQQERWEEALKELEQARQEQPTNAVIENTLGMAATKLGRINDGNRHYQ